MNTQSRLQYFPVTFFSAIMGLTGFTIAIQRVESMLKFNSIFSTLMLYLSSLIFITILLLYIAKIIKFPNAVLNEASNPIRINFFPTFTISLLLLSIAFLEVNMTISLYLWMLGAALHFIATIIILSMWIRQNKFEIHHFNPSWFIPIVGNLIVPIAGLKHFSPDLSWFFFSIGIVFWILLFSIFMYRIIFHQALPDKLMPTLFILIAPPAVGFVSYVKLIGVIDSFAKILYFLALFLVILLLAQIKMFYKLEFYLSWWAYSFPIAAITLATSLFYLETGITLYKMIFFALLILLTVLIVMLFWLTIKAISEKKICLKEE